jgi:2-dehydropantoate 2-reductase
MRICVVGTGAIGGLVGAGLTRTGEDVTLVDVGPRLEAMRRDGLTVLRGAEQPRVVREVRFTDSVEEAGAQDVVILGLKAHAIAEVAETLPTLFGPDTVVVTLQNGIPWWYFQRHGGELDGWRLNSVDPDGRIAEHIEPERIIGCVAYPAAAVERPGVIRHVYGRRLPVGELDGRNTERARAVAELFARGGFDSMVVDDIRAEIWLKAVGVLAFNSISALSRATMAQICAHAATRRLAMELMAEAEAVAEALGVRLRVPIERRLSGAEKVGDHRTSMLQDVEAGRRLEVEALVGSVVEIGHKLGVPTPFIEEINACVQLLDEQVDTSSHKT